MRKPVPETRVPRQAAVPRQTGQTTKPQAPRRRPAWQIALLVLPALCCTAALVFVVRRPVELCRQWEHEARTADGPAALDAVDQLDRFGRYGFPALVRLLDAENPEVVAAACRALTARVRQWQPSASDADRAALETLAAELTARFAQRRESAPRETVDFTLELLDRIGRMGLEQSLDDELRDRLLAACDEVLRRAPPPLAAPAVPLAAMLPPLPTKQTTAPTPPPEPTPTATVAAMLAPASPRVAVAVPPAEPPPEPTPLPAANAAARINPIRETTADAAVHPASLPATGPRIQPPAAADDLSRIDAWTLFARLVGPHREASIAELRRRGFSAREIELGEHLTSSDATERQRYAAELPALGVTEARPWLLRLSRDEDADVRRTAVTIMATTGDPALQEVLRRLSLEDADEEIRRTAGRATGRVR